MKVFTLFVEPAAYTLDLIKNVHHKLGISHAYLHSSSVASDQTNMPDAATTRYFDQHSFFSNLSFLWKCTRNHQLIIVNGYNHSSFIFLWIFGMLNSCCIGIESDTPLQKRHGIIALLKSAYLKLIFSPSHVLGLPGGNGKHYDLFAHYGMAENRIFLLPMMVDNAKYFKELPPGQPTPPQLVRFLCVARLAPEKNIPLLIAAFKELVKQYQNVQLDLVGDGPSRTALEELITDSPQIKLHGKKFGAALLQFYKDSHVLVLPSAFEPWGLVVNEAMAAGLAVICSDQVGAAYDLLSRTHTGWIFESNNQQDLTATLVNLLQNPHQIYSSGKSAQEFMMSHWNYKRYTDSLNQIFSYVKHP